VLLLLLWRTHHPAVPRNDLAEPHASPSVTGTMSTTETTGSVQCPPSPLFPSRAILPPRRRHLLHQCLHDHVSENRVLLGIERLGLVVLAIHDGVVELVQLEHVRVGVRRSDDLFRVVARGELGLDGELDGEALDVGPAVESADHAREDRT